jgi:hypothetical protein
MKHLKAFENYSGINEEFKEIDREAFDYIINREAPSEFIKYVYDNTNVKDHGTLEEYIEWVDSKYKNYFITHHYSKSDDILHSVIKTPEQRGGSYNSADGFFVSPKLRIEEHKMNFFVMIPKNLNFLLTDYNFSNIPDFYKDFIKIDDPVRSIFKYNADHCRSLGYDAIVPKGAQNEIIILNPSTIVVLGSVNDIEGFKLEKSYQNT